MDNEQLNTVELDGEAKISGMLRPPIKMGALSNSPHIVICMPVGGNNGGGVFECPACEDKWFAPTFRAPNVVPVELFLRAQQMQPILNGTTAFLCESGRLSGEARQIMTKQALRMGAKYILYWDDDVIPAPMALYEMHNWMERHPDVGALSAVYVTREEPCEPLIYKQHGTGAWWDFPMGEGAEPQQCFAAGAGYLLARADAIRDAIEGLKRDSGGVEQPIWADGSTSRVYDGQEEVDGIQKRAITWGHDVRFCKLLQDYGWPVYVDGRQLMSHIDVATGRIFDMPGDAPGFKIQREININTGAYWDQVYGHEGANSWRQYPEMFQKVVDAAEGAAAVTELGCGVGILGSKLTASIGCRYRGYDISEQAVAYAKARFLNAYQLDLRALEIGQLDDIVVATEVLEHLDEDVFHHVLSTIHEGPVKKFIFTVPDNCMGPDEVPEHTALFNEQLVRERLAGYEGWQLSVEKADEQHLICIMER
jgi:hypothetical protein